MHSIRVLIYGLGWALLMPGTVLARFQGDPGVPCFRVVDEQIVEIDDAIGGQRYAEILDVRLNPEWVTDLKFDEVVHIAIRYRIASCRPFYVFVDPLWDHRNDVSWFVSGSPVYEPGVRDDAHTGFVGFEQKEASSTDSHAAIHGVRVTIVEFGTSRLLAEREIGVNVSWRAGSKMLTDTEECVDRLVWPAQREPIRACSNSTEFTLQSGFRVADKMDLNQDGICELVVEAESCRKLGGNTCYKVFAEREDYFKEIWTFYNALAVFGDENGFARLGSTEDGPLTDVHRFGVYDALRSRYVTRTFVQPCFRQ